MHCFFWLISWFMQRDETARHSHSTDPSPAKVGLFIVARHWRRLRSAHIPSHAGDTPSASATRTQPPRRPIDPNAHQRQQQPPKPPPFLVMRVTPTAYDPPPSACASLDSPAPPTASRPSQPRGAPAPRRWHSCPPPRPEARQRPRTLSASPRPRSAHVIRPARHHLETTERPENSTSTLWAGFFSRPEKPP